MVPLDHLEIQEDVVTKVNEEQLELEEYLYDDYDIVKRLLIMIMIIFKGRYWKYRKTRNTRTKWSTG